MPRSRAKDLLTPLSRIFLLYICCSYFPALAQLDLSLLTEKQRLFLQVQDTIKTNDRALIADYKKKLADYPLAPYIAYFDYLRHIDSTPNPIIENFIEQNSENHLGLRLKYRWLKHLGQTQQWSIFLKNYVVDEFNAQSILCYATLAKLNTHPNSEEIKFAQQLWKTGKPLIPECQPLDAYLHKKKQITGSMIWENINLAMLKNQQNYATKLAKNLSANERAIYQAWLKIASNPAQLNHPLPKNFPGQVKQNIFIHGIKKLSKQNPELANRYLSQDASRYGLSHQETLDLKRIISLRMARSYQTQAKDILSEVNEEDSSENTLRWQLQVALRQSDWPTVLETFEKVNEEDQDSEKWQYWLARALEETGEYKKATKIFKTLSKQRDYYGFLAADKMKTDYQFNPSPVKKIDPKTLLKNYPQLVRIKELLAIDWKLNANREWQHLLKHVKTDELEAISYLAADWHQHAMAIQSAAKAEDWNNLELRFPTPHKTPVLQAAKDHNIDPAWVYGVIRRESAFSEEVRSPVGATGLMQLMPQTAKFISNKIGADPSKYKNLTDANSNIELGTAYLSHLNHKYSGHRILATAAYNAGPNRVDQWIPDDQALPADQWIDSLPITETRRYVKAVLEYTTIFQSLLHQKYERLSNVMLPIGQTQLALKLENDKEFEPTFLGVKK